MVFCYAAPLRFFPWEAFHVLVEKEKSPAWGCSMAYYCLHGLAGVDSAF